MKILVALVLCGVYAVGDAVMCSKSLTMYDLPHGAIESAISMATVGTVVSFTGCLGKGEIDPNKVVFWLYTNNNKDVPVPLNKEDPKELNFKEPIIFITHGWTCNITGNGFPELKDAYLKRYPTANVILVEWTTYSVDLYVNSYCFIPNIAVVFGKFICTLSSKYNVDISQLHLIGHSMGGQISGLTGQETQKQCQKKIGRITALDPAGPIYQDQPPNHRLDANDATLVDVIHSNQGQFGYYGSCGTIDYYPNCGFFQPKCVQLTPLTDFKEFTNTPFSVLACSHQRSIELFVESIGSDAFVAKSCTFCPGLPPLGTCVPDAFKAATSIMGEHLQSVQGSKKFYIATRGQAPYAL